MNFSLLGSLVNAIAVIVGGLIGMLFKKGIPEKIKDGLMNVLSLCVMFIAVTGAINPITDSETGNIVSINTLVIIFSAVFGTILGEILDLDSLLNRLGRKVESKFSHSENSVAEGFVTASLLFCVGSMSIIGPLESGLLGNHSMQFTKSILDFCSSIIFASSLGIGVVLSSVLILVYQGTITLCASWLAPVLSDYVIGHMICIGSLLLLGLAFNMLKITKIKVMNMIPSIFLPIALCPLSNYILSLF